MFDTIIFGHFLDSIGIGFAAGSLFSAVVCIINLGVHMLRSFANLH